MFDWDEGSGELRTQLEEFPLLTFYENGAVMAGWSHNQGKGGDFWPYFLYQYLPETDGYQQVGAVDAWDRALGIEGYPDQVDRSGTGFVYYIYGDLAAEWTRSSRWTPPSTTPGWTPIWERAKSWPFPIAADSREHPDDPDGGLTDRDKRNAFWKKKGCF